VLARHASYLQRPNCPFAFPDETPRPYNPLAEVCDRSLESSTTPFVQASGLHWLHIFLHRRLRASPSDHSASEDCDEQRRVHDSEDELGDHRAGVPDTRDRPVIREHTGMKPVQSGPAEHDTYERYADAVDDEQNPGEGECKPGSKESRRVRAS
jgi:hypothetical protein